MSQKRTFICPRCLMADRHTAEVNGMESIAYSMPQEVFKKLHKSLEKDHAELAKEVSAQQDLIRCITWSDVYECLQNSSYTGTTLRGNFTLTSQWLKKNAARFKISAKNLEDLGDMVLYQEELLFAYDDKGDYLFPVNIRNAHTEALLSDERRCVKCGRLLPPDTGRADELRILLQGTSRAGKTSCIIAIINMLLTNNHQVRSGFRAELTTGGSGAANAERYHNWIEQEVAYYRSGIRVEKTPTVQNEPGVYSLLVKIDDQELVLTFVDMPGEYFDHVKTQAEQQDEQLLRQYVPIYKNCHFIWTCLRYETVVETQKTEERMKALAENTGLTKDLFFYTEYKNYRKRLADLISEFKRRGFTIPHHAVILTMTDSIVSEHHPSAEELEFLRRCYIIPDHNGTQCSLLPLPQNGRKNENRLLFQERQCYNLCRGVSTYVRSKNDNLYNLFEDFSKESRYFAMAAYGHNAAKRPSGNTADRATAQGGIPPAPFQADAAFLWSLAVSGYLPIQYTVRYYRELSLLKRVIRGNSEEPAGERLEICEHFARADEETKANLLHNKNRYTEHTSILRGGETL